jgi:hypothetical protein
MLFLIWCLIFWGLGYVYALSGIFPSVFTLKQILVYGISVGLITLLLQPGYARYVNPPLPP